MYHYVIYKTTCLVNNKIYIGKHMTKDINDDYLGSGVELKKDIQLYGPTAFKKEILFECENEEKLNQLEKEIVNKEFVNRSDTYNQNVGGSGSWKLIPHEKHSNLHNWRRIGIMSYIDKGLPNPGLEYIKHLTKEEKKHYCQSISNGLKEYFSAHKSWWIGRHHKKESKNKISEKNKISLKGKSNYMYGKKWMNNPELKQNKIVPQDKIQEYTDHGWLLGRKMTF